MPTLIPIVESGFYFSRPLQKRCGSHGAAIIPVPAPNVRGSQYARAKVRFICLCSSWPYERFGISDLPLLLQALLS